MRNCVDALMRINANNAMRKYLNALMSKCVYALMRNYAKKEHAINNMLLIMDNIYH